MQTLFPTFWCPSGLGQEGSFEKHGAKFFPKEKFCFVLWFYSQGVHSNQRRPDSVGKICKKGKCSHHLSPALGAGERRWETGTGPQRDHAIDNRRCFLQQRPYLASPEDNAKPAYFSHRWQGPASGVRIAFLPLLGLPPSVWEASQSIIFLKRFSPVSRLQIRSVGLFL